MTTVSRREFLLSLAGSTAAFAFATPLTADGGVRAGLILPHAHPATASVARGARFGENEAQWTARLMKRSFDLSVSEVSSREEAAREARRMVSNGISTVFGGISASFCTALSTALPEFFLEIRDRSEVSGDEPPPRHPRITPARHEYARALFRALQRRGLATVAFADDDPDSRALAIEEGLRILPRDAADFLFTSRPAASPGILTAGVTLASAPGTAIPVAWHSSLEKFGAGELNERFRDATGQEMNEAAWFGWAATKIILETSLRGRPVSQARLDGHKGSPLAFDEGFLRQPLYVLLHRDDGIEVLDA